MVLVIDALTQSKEMLEKKISILNKLECKGISGEEYIAIGFAIAVIDKELTRVKNQITDAIMEAS